ncbi:MAG: hypothetical protein L0Y55_15925, partial [Anaerolineales bacterium]|nr:hypothetical protein [Anaerolineales bacterium]
MENVWNFWNSLTQGFRENLAAQIIGGVIAALIAAGVTFFCRARLRQTRIEISKSGSSVAATNPATTNHRQ